MYFSGQEREKKEKHINRSLRDNPTMICLHAPHHVEEDTSVHLVIWRMTRFGHREASNASL
jgi:hypothetical protein